MLSESFYRKPQGNCVLEDLGWLWSSVCLCECVCVWVCVSKWKRECQTNGKHYKRKSQAQWKEKHRTGRGPFRQSSHCHPDKRKRERLSTKSTHVTFYLFRDLNRDRSRLLVCERGRRWACALVHVLSGGRKGQKQGGGGGLRQREVLGDKRRDRSSTIISIHVHAKLRHLVLKWMHA